MYFGFVTSIIYLDGRNTKNEPLSFYWKVKDLTANRIIWEGEAITKQVNATAGHNYKVVALHTPTKKWAAVNPSDFKMSDAPKFVTAKIDASTPQDGKCYVKITANRPGNICYRDSANVKECVQDKDSWNPQVRCGAIRVAGQSKQMQWAQVLPKNEQIATPTYTPEFHLIFPEAQELYCKPVAWTGNAGRGNISVCGWGDVSGVISSQDGSTNITFSGVQAFQDVKEGWYYVHNIYPANATITPNPFKVVEGHTTDVVFTAPAEPQTPAGTPPIIAPYTRGEVYYPQTAYSTESSEMSFLDKIITWLSVYKWYLVVVGGGSVGIYFYLKKKKKRYPTMSMAKPALGGK